MMVRNRRSNQRMRSRSPEQMHREWLELVDTDGPFLAAPVLKRAWPQGMPPLKTLENGQQRASELRQEKAAFEAAWDEWHRVRVGSDDDKAVADATRKYREQEKAWVLFILRRLLDWREDYRLAEDDAAEAAAYDAESSNGAIQVSPSGLLELNDTVGAVVLMVDPVVENLTEIPDDGWNASAIDRMQHMLRAKQATCSIGLVTDGRWWALVSAPKGKSAAWGQFDSQMWIDTPQVLNAFVNLLSIRSLVTDTEKNRLPALFAESVTAAEDITEALGGQVRQAVELIVAAFNESSARARNAGRPDPLPDDGEKIYEAAVTVMMRVVFLLFAQERGLLPRSGLFENAYGLAGMLDMLEERARDEGEEAMDGTSMVWHRLLATSQALYGGANFEDMRLPAYGGSVFDPQRAPFLVATDEHGELTVVVPDRVMHHVLRSVQIAVVGRESRRISFRDIDVEQIGYIYEGLLGYTCLRSKEVVLGLEGAKSQEPEVPLSALEQIAADSADDASGAKRATAIEEWVKANASASKTPSRSKMGKLLTGSSPEDVERALLSVTHDKAMQDRLRPWMGLIRRDLRGKPVVFLAGDLYVAETSSRKDAGAHYTPRALAEEVVVHALEPLIYQPGPLQTNDRSQWRHISSTDLLNLHVADIACGSGAFLVAAARYLSAELVEAWRLEHALPYDGTPEQTRLKAIRMVVARCLYGVDINEMAVEMCKLSLWLVSLDKNQPFSFVDNKILHGNSLLGVTNLAQVEYKRIDAKPRQQIQLFEINDLNQIAGVVDASPVIRRVRNIREQLSSEISADDPQRSAVAKHRQMHEMDEALTQLRKIADGVVAAGLRSGGVPGKQMDEEYDNLAVAVGRAFPSEGEGDSRMLDDIIDSGLKPIVPTDYEHWQCVHWPLEIPEVMENGGFDAIIGNPPFLGGQKLTGTMGKNVREWYVNTLAGGNRGSADLCAYFYLRSYSLMRKGAMLGLLATNTIAQGDTREVGLDRMVNAGFTITRSIQSKPWPVSSANLEYAAVWGIKGTVPDTIAKDCDGAEVVRISTLLEPHGRVMGNPVALKENQNISFIGCNIVGKGFIVTRNQVNEWVKADSRNKEVLFPYLNGDDLNSNPDSSASRWVIDFNDRSEEKAKSYTAPYKHLFQYVKPEREKNHREVYRDYWWQYAEKRPALRKAISALKEVLVLTRVSKVIVPVKIKTGIVLSDALVIFASNSYADQAVLSSSMHQYWAISRGSSLETRLRYTPSDVFETFPRPQNTDALAAIGKTLDEERREIMLRRQLGLTKLYNLVNDPDISDSFDADVARLREIHRHPDETVMAAYGWSDVRLNHGFYEYRKMIRWTVCPEARIEILDRLLEENHRRAKLEAAQGGEHE